MPLPALCGRYRSQGRKWKYGVVQFDHLVHWVPSLDAAVQGYPALGFTVQPGGSHSGSGTHNAAWRLDTRYIELIAVCDEPAARAGFGPGWPEIDATLRAGGGALAFGVLVDDVAATVADLRSRGVRAGDPRAGSIRRTDGSTGVWHYAGLQDRPRWAPFFINYGLRAGQWASRFPEQGFPKDPWALHGVTVQVRDPAASASWLGMSSRWMPCTSVRTPSRSGCPAARSRSPAVPRIASPRSSSAGPAPPRDQWPGSATWTPLSRGNRLTTTQCDKAR
jgi:Glyoxalase-like domain